MSSTDPTIDKLVAITIYTSLQLLTYFCLGTQGVRQEKNFISIRQIIVIRNIFTMLALTFQKTTLDLQKQIPKSLISTVPIL